MNTGKRSILLGLCVSWLSVLPFTPRIIIGLAYAADGIGIYLFGLLLLILGTYLGLKTRKWQWFFLMHGISLVVFSLIASYSVNPVFPNIVLFCYVILFAIFLKNKAREDSSNSYYRRNKVIALVGALFLLWYGFYSILLSYNSVSVSIKSYVSEKNRVPILSIAAPQFLGGGNCKIDVDMTAESLSIDVLSMKNSGYLCYTVGSDKMIAIQLPSEWLGKKKNITVSLGRETAELVLEQSDYQLTLTGKSTSNIRVNQQSIPMNPANERGLSLYMGNKMTLDADTQKKALLDFASKKGFPLISYEEPFVIDKRNPEYMFLRVLLPFELLMPRFTINGNSSSYMPGDSDLGLWDVQTSLGLISVRVYGNVLFDDSDVINPNVINP